MSLAAIYGPVIGGEVVKDVFDKVKSDLDQLMENAATIFDNVVEDLIHQIQATLTETIRDLDEVLEERVADIDSRMQMQVYSVFHATKTLIDEFERSATGLSKTVNRDIRQTLARISFIGEIYALDTIDNTLVPYLHEGDWVVIAKGVGIGFDSEELKSDAKLVLFRGEPDELSVTGLEVSDTEVHFTIPADVIASRRDRESMMTIDGHLVFHIVKDRLLWFDKKFRIEQPFRLTLAPDLLATFQTHATQPVLQWVRRTGLNRTASKGLPSGHATSSSKVVHHHTRWNMDLPSARVPPRRGDMRFYQANWNGCSGSGCGFVKVHTLQVQNGGSRIHCHVENWSHAVHVSVTGQVERYDHVSDQSTQSDPKKAYYSEPLDLEFPLGFSSVRITGRARNSQHLDLVITRNPDTSVYPMPSGDFGGLRFVGSTVKADAVVYHFHAE